MLMETSAPAQPAFQPGSVSFPALAPGAAPTPSVGPALAATPAPLASPAPTQYVAAQTLQPVTVGQPGGFGGIPPASSQASAPGGVVVAQHGGHGLLQMSPQMSVSYTHGPTSIANGPIQQPLQPFPQLSGIGSGTGQAFPQIGAFPTAQLGPVASGILPPSGSMIPPASGGLLPPSGSLLQPQSGALGQPVEIGEYLAAKDRQLEELNRHLATLRHTLQVEREKMTGQAAAAAAAAAAADVQHFRETSAVATVELSALKKEIAQAAELSSQLNDWFVENESKMRTSETWESPAAFLDSATASLRQQIDAFEAQWKLAEASFTEEQVGMRASASAASMPQPQPQRQPQATHRVQPSAPSLAPIAEEFAIAQGAPADVAQQQHGHASHAPAAASTQNGAAGSGAAPVAVVHQPHLPGSASTSNMEDGQRQASTSQAEREPEREEDRGAHSTSGAVADGGRSEGSLVGNAAAPSDARATLPLRDQERTAAMAAAVSPQREETEDWSPSGRFNSADDVTPTGRVPRYESFCIASSP